MFLYIDAGYISENIIDAVISQESLVKNLHQQVNIFPCTNVFFHGAAKVVFMPADGAGFVAEDL